MVTIYKQTTSSVQTQLVYFLIFIWQNSCGLWKRVRRNCTGQKSDLKKLEVYSLRHNRSNIHKSLHRLLEAHFLPSFSQRSYGSHSDLSGEMSCIIASIVCRGTKAATSLSSPVLNDISSTSAPCVQM